MLPLVYTPMSLVFERADLASFGVLGTLIGGKWLARCEDLGAGPGLGQ